MMYLRDVYDLLEDLRRRKMLPPTPQETREIIGVLERVCALGHDLECDPNECSCWRRLVVSKDGK